MEHGPKENGHNAHRTRGRGLCNCAPMCTCATHSLTQSGSGCRVRRRVRWTPEDIEQKVIDIWHIAGLTYTPTIDWQGLIPLNSTAVFRDSPSEIKVSLSRAQSNLQLRFECMISCVLWRCVTSQLLKSQSVSLSHTHKHTSITFSLQLGLPDQPEIGQAEMHNRVWACLTSTNSFPRHRVKYKSQRWSLPHRIRFLSVGKY